MSEETVTPEVKTGAKFRKYTQAEANYTMESPVANQHCASCRWYVPEDDFVMCHIVESYPQPIVATGHSQFYAPYPEPNVVSNAPTFEEIFEKFTEESKETETREGMVTKFINSIKSLLGDKPVEFDANFGFKAIGNRWFAMWTNNFEDDEGEYFAEKAIDDFIARADKGETPMPTLQFWHIPYDIGDADWLARDGHMGLASGTFRDDAISRKFEKHFGRKESIHAYKVSHGFFYPMHTKQNGIYLYFNTFEISPLPAYAAANPYTYFGGDGMIPKDKKDKLAEVLEDPRYVDVMLAAVEKANKEAEAQGRGFKDVTKVEVVDSEARQGIEAVKSMLTDLDAKLDKAMKKPTDEEDEDEKKKKAERDAAYKKELGTLETQVKAMSDKLTQFLELEPRRSSKAKETEISGDDPLLKEAKEGRDADESQRVTQTVFGGMLGHGG